MSKQKKAKPKMAEKPLHICRMCKRPCNSKFELKRHVCRPGLS